MANIGYVEINCYFCRAQLGYGEQMGHFKCVTCFDRDAVFERHNKAANRICQEYRIPRSIHEVLTLLSQAPELSQLQKNQFCWALSALDRDGIPVSELLEDIVSRHLWRKAIGKKAPPETEEFDA